MTKSEFLKTAAPITVAVAGVAQQLAPRKFGEGKPETDRSVGYNYNGKVPLPAGAGLVEVVVNGVPVAATKLPPKDGRAKPLYYGTSKVAIDGVPFQVGANITDLGDGRGQATVNVTAVKSKAWSPGDPAAEPEKAPAPKATAALAAAPTPAGPKSMTYQEALAALAAETGMKPEKLSEKMVNKFANTRNITLVG